MAEITVSMKIDNANAAKSISEMQKALKALVSAQNDVTSGSDEWKKLNKTINETEGKIGNLTASFQTLKGSGVDRLKSSFGLLTEGFESFDTDKIKTGFKGMGAAMSALPMFALIEAVKLVVENFDIVIDFFKSMTTAAKEQKMALSELSTSYSDLARNLDEIAFKEKEYLRNSAQANALAIEKAKQRGATEKEINELTAKSAQDKLNIIEKAETNYRKQKVFADGEYSKALATGDEDAIKKAKEILDKATSLYQGSLDKRKDLSNELNLTEASNHTASIERGKVEAEKAKAEAEKTKEYNRKRRLEDDAWDLQADKDLAEQKKVIDVEERDLKAEALNESLMKYTEDLAERKRLRAEEMKDIKDGLTNTAVGIQTISSLNDTLFSIKSANTKKGSKEDEEAARKHFQMNKALQLGTAVVNGAQSVLAITSVPDFTLGIASALRIAAQVALTAKVIATIASAKFQPSGGGGSVGGGGSIGGGPIPSPQQQEVPQPRQQSTEFDNEGNKKGGAIVLVSEINETQRSLARVKEQARF